MKAFRIISLTISFLIMGSCKKESNNTLVPVISLPGSVNVYEDDPTGNVRIPIVLNAPATKTINVIYSTSDSSAKSGIDYQGIIRGEAQIQQGNSSFIILVPIYSDTLQKHNLVFKVHIDSITNSSIQNRDVHVTIINVDYANLVWSDEFNDSTINASNWNFESGNNNGWGNNELESYTNSLSNAYISNGCLIIKAISSNGYTSARMTTQNKRTFVTGRVDIRAKLPMGKGIWPALWMLGSDITTVSWPQCGEIDIMELLGQKPYYCIWNCTLL